MSGVAATFYTQVSGELPLISSMSFADEVPVPVWNLHDEISGTVGDALTTQTTVRSEAGSERELFFFRVAHLRDRAESFTDDAMTGRARAYASAGVVNINSMRQRYIQNAARQASVAKRNLLRIHFDGHVHRKKCDRKLLRRRCRRFLIDVRISPTHKGYGTAILCGGGLRLWPFVLSFVVARLFF